MKTSFAAKFMAVAVAVFFLAAFTNTALAKEKVLWLKGAITSVDTAAKSFVVKEKKGEATVVTNETTKISLGKEKKTFEDLKAGETVHVKYHKQDGKLMAANVYLAGGKKMEKAGGKMEKSAGKTLEKHG